jgi:hypothetical protein
MSGGGEGRYLAEIGRDASRAAQRAALLETLEACQWRLSDAAKTLRMDCTGNVLRSIKVLGLTDEYQEAKRAGLIVRGRHHLSPLTNDRDHATVRAMEPKTGSGT